MKLTKLIFITILFSGNINAQVLKTNIIVNKTINTNDSIFVDLNLQIDVDDIKTDNQIRLIPTIKKDENSVELKSIIINGEKRQKKFTREQYFNKSNRQNSYGLLKVFSERERKLDFNYTTSAHYEDWMINSNVVVLQEIIDSKGKIIKKSTIEVSKNDSFKEVPYQMERSFLQSRSTNSNELKYKGTYITPLEDDINRRNKKDYNFTLDEAKVMAKVNPQILSLLELYNVALSFKNNLAKFYEIIFLSVKIYPADPIANLNAASASIELNKTNNAIKYLQLASHETLAYKNCRGVYELRCGNISEGMLLLKEAKRDGSEDAGYNLLEYIKTESK